ncbi:cysteine desulfurase [Streptococcus intermedius]|uniref:MalY/PatB family protein n=1 Tax=Streptococcus intermedius TaxID=1338 RepID=UPI00029BD61C|nr:MalY/PatB family protein [Streptococcus intermedius]ALF28018.1 cysteine desulfurase [Streptococcus intermedius]ARC26253.1 pyridoxal phosphate-dependent aminotransferase [Streptococcus intermedius]EKU17775.1 L-cysteine desulfhydrase [Streptococcus intermedius BA1]
MSKYNFQTAPNRLSHHAYKWKETENDPQLLPAWIADMDFEVMPEVKNAIHKYAERLVYGYTYASDELLQAVLDWEKNEHQYSFDKDAVVFVEGVVPSISIAIQAFTKEGEAVLINSPVYPPFARSVQLNHRKLVSNSLKEENGLFQIDFEQLEKDLIENHVKLYLLCNPHNPGGRVWEREVLEQIGHLCQKHHVILVSDEIHQDLTLFGHEHVSFNTVSPDFKDFALVLSSATKTFNIAGTKNSYAIIENPSLRTTFKHQQLVNNHHEVSSLGYIATETAYRYGKPWLVALKAVLEENIQFAVEYFAQEAPRLKVMKPQGTYLIWLDFSDYGLTDDELFTLLHDQAKVILNRGSDYGSEGKLHARLNIATPKSLVEEICKRIVRCLPK